MFKLLCLVVVILVTFSSPTDPVQIQVTSNEKEVVVRAGEFTITAQLSPWNIKVVDMRTSKVLLQDTELSYSLFDGKDWPVYLGYTIRLGKINKKVNVKNISSWKQVQNTVEFYSRDPEMTIVLHDFRRRQVSFSATTPGMNSPLKEPRVFLEQNFFTPPNEGFFGLGERFVTNNHRGYFIDNTVEEGGWSIGDIQNYFAPPTVKIRVPKQHSTHFPIPFFISNLKYGFEIDTNYTSSFDFALKKKDEYIIQVQSTKLGWTLYGGNSPKETLSMYTERRGRSLIPPSWGFGPWNQLGGEFNHTGNELEAAREFLKLDIPVSHCVNTVHFLPTNDEDNREQQLKEMNQKLLDMGLKSTSYFNPYVASSSRDYNICDKNGYFVKHHNTSDSYTFIYLGSRFFNCSMFDYTNPEANKYYHKILQRSTDLNFNGAMYDYAEYLPYYSKSANGKYGDELHNIHPVLYQKSVYDYLSQFKTSDKYAPDFIFYCRSGYTGTQKYQWATWTGDPSSDWSYAAGLPAQVPASVNLGLAGVPYSGSDIGGFTWWVQRPPTPELWCRWSQLGAFSGYMHTQTGGMGIGRKTKMLNTNEGRYCWRKFAKLRTQLFPYIYTAAHQSHETGIPMMRHHLLEFPDDQFAHEVGYDFMFGDSILVSAVVHRGEVKKQVYLPKGFEWYDLMSNLIYDVKDGRFRVKHSSVLRGGSNVTVDSPTWDHIPLFVKAGTIIPAIDPSVFTLTNAKEENVISLNKREHLLHLWIFLDYQNKAKCSTWDNAVISFDNNKMFIQDEKNRIMIIQISLGTNKFSNIRGSGSGVYKRVDSYQDLISVDRNSSQSLFTYSSQEGVLWIRTNPRDKELNFN